MGEEDVVMRSIQVGRGREVASFSVIKRYLVLGWTFDKWYEKIIFAIIFVLGIWKFFEIIFQL